MRRACRAQEDIVSYLICYMLAGIAAGFLAGLLGIGGGLVLVPALALLFALQGFPADAIMQLALGTSLASIVFTSASSARAHHAKGAVDWLVLRRMAPGIVAGALLSAWLAARLSGPTLQLFFAVYAGLAATQLVCEVRPRTGCRLPGLPGLAVTGAVVGLTAGLAGVGGAIAAIPFFLWCNVPARIAIGTSAAIGLPVALAGSVGYIAQGLSAEVPEFSVGYLYAPALVAIVVTGLLAVPLGARVSHSMPVPALKKILAAVLYAVMLRAVFAGA
jgi:uncharacterized membrane protein YfcA